ncbi:hypothetical protein [Streptomyces sp. MNU77]|nr:hypothetical protein [Streptomyces sp. MNU77]
MFNVLAAEAGEVGHPSHEYFLHRGSTVIDSNARTLRASVV